MTEDAVPRREGFHPCLCFNIRQAARRVTGFYDAHLAKTGLTAAQFALLAEIAASTGIPISEIAERLSLDPSTLSRTLQPLETGGLIEVRPDPANRRLRRVQLTQAGRGKLREGAQAWRQAQTAATQVLPEGLVQELSAAAARLPDIGNPGRPKRRRPGPASPSA